MIMEHAKPFTGAIDASAGKLYTVENVKMAGGHMLYDILSPSNPNYVPTLSSDPRVSAGEEPSLAIVSSPSLTGRDIRYDS